MSRKLSPKVEQIFNGALEVEPSQRAAFLDEACAGDGELRKQLESLLKWHEGGEEFLKKPLLRNGFRVERVATESMQKYDVRFACFIVTS